MKDYVGYVRQTVRSSEVELVKARTNLPSVKEFRLTYSSKAHIGNYRRVFVVS